MWVTAFYESTALFSLKPAAATASGGKTLLVPTPFAVKMGLLDIACRTIGVDAAERAWQWLGMTRVALQPAQAVVVNNTFTKVLKPRRNPAEPGSQDVGFFGRTIAYREYAYLEGQFGIGLEVETTTQAEQVTQWLIHLNYLGKRGSFIQWVAGASLEILPDDFLVVDGQIEGMAINALLTQLDDVGDDLTFTRASVYTSDPIKLGKHRVLRHLALPYRLAASSRSYSHYVRTEDET